MALLKSVPIDTGGATSKHVIRIEDRDNGDMYIAAYVPVWPNNKNVVHSVLKLLTACHNRGAHIYFEKDEAIIHLYQSVCDPD
jgi:hypothetical protein